MECATSLPKLGKGWERAVGAPEYIPGRRRAGGDASPGSRLPPGAAGHGSSEPARTSRSHFSCLHVVGASSVLTRFPLIVSASLSSIAWNPICANVSTVKWSLEENVTYHIVSAASAPVKHRLRQARRDPLRHAILPHPSPVPAPGMSRRSRLTLLLLLPFTLKSLSRRPPVRPPGIPSTRVPRRLNVHCI